MTAKPKSKSRVKPATMPKPKSKTAQKTAGRKPKDAKMKFPESDVLDALSNGGNMLFDPAADEIIDPRPVAELPGFAEGLISVQDAGAQLAAPLLTRFFHLPCLARRNVHFVGSSH